MELFRGLESLKHPGQRAVVTVGMFDGMHIAHQRLIQSVLRLAHSIQGTSVVVTFDPDPQTVLDSAHAQPILMPLSIRLGYLERFGVDRVVVIPFTRRFSKLRGEQFVREILIRRLKAVVLVVGDAFLFGRDRQGDMALLKQLGPRHDMRVVALQPVRRAGELVSSSRIRRLIQQGHLSQARQLLGRPATLYGTVVRGVGRGRRLGLPTANIALSSQVTPAQGVYAVIMQDEPVYSRRAREISHRRWTGVMNLGVRPSFGGGAVVCEVHVLNFSGRLYGRKVSVSLLGKLRGERCFEDPQALVRQVRRDIARSRKIIRRFLYPSLTDARMRWRNDW